VKFQLQRKGKLKIKTLAPFKILRKRIDFFFDLASGNWIALNTPNDRPLFLNNIIGAERANEEGNWIERFTSAGYYTIQKLTERD